MGFYNSGKNELWVNIDRYGVMRPTKNIKLKDGGVVDRPEWITKSNWYAVGWSGWLDWLLVVGCWLVGLVGLVGLVVGCWWVGLVGR
jgi:hypothetical protein